MARRIPYTKLIVLAVLGFAALILGSVVLTFQLQIIQEKNRRGLHGKQKTGKTSGKDGTTTTTKTSSNNLDSKDGSDNKSKYQEEAIPANSLTVKNSVPTGAYDIRLWNVFPAAEGGNDKTIGEAYWRQVQAFLRDWKDAAVYPVHPSDFHSESTDWMVRKSSEYRSNKANATNNDAYHFYPRLALERAADAGHPMAQHYLANAHASGIWPVPVMGGGADEYVSGENPAVENLHVFDEWLPSDGEHTRQIDKAYLLWHMAAIGGNIESAMALAYRLDTPSSGSSASKCEDVLPYYQAAADGVMDQLEVSQDSRAKVVPFMDKHTLAQVHMHGGTSSQLDWNNKPDESKEALQFYHLKATTVPWSLKKKRGTSESDSTKGKTGKSAKVAVDEDDGIDVAAANALAQMYHHGLRGVEQNLTKSLLYYEIAGSHGHRESAGQACIFHLWGIGTKQDAFQALEFCSLGAPLGFQGCVKMHDDAEAVKNNKRSDSGQIQECDEVALNGLGLLHLLGIQGVLKIDTRMAEKYFALAKQQGSIDAHYNLAMMWLGWKTHFKSVDELQEGGFTPHTESSESVLPIPGQKKEKDVNEKYVLYKAAVGDNMYYKGPIQSDVQSAIKVLTVAAKHGHLQAKHRLASIYAEGLNHTTSVIQYNFVKKDCKKAKEYFQWIISTASPTRSDRLRRAYKEYIARNLEASVRNYLAAAEIGSIVGQVNAAFLMERGVCLGLSAADCAKASVRLWKVAALRGNPEASLRVGDFYYYGRLHGDKLYTGPFGWIQYLLLPEKYIPVLFQEFGKEILHSVMRYLGLETKSRTPTISSPTCLADEDTCRIYKPHLETATHTKRDFRHEMEEDLHNAAHYYQLAAEKHLSARANFNLGFMHQWGLGLKQDFPMAKRHYDLALSRNYHESEIAVQIALTAMNLHEFAIRCKVSIEDWWHQRQPSTTISSSGESSPTSANAGAKSPEAGSEPAQSQARGHKKTKEEVIMSHLFDESSLVIAILFLILIIIQVIMSYVGQPQGR